MATFVACECVGKAQKSCPTCKGSGLVEAKRVGDSLFLVPFANVSKAPTKKRATLVRVK